MKYSEATNHVDVKCMECGNILFELLSLSEVDVQQRSTVEINYSKVAEEIIIDSECCPTCHDATKEDLDSVIDNLTDEIVDCEGENSRLSGQNREYELELIKLRKQHVCRWEQESGKFTCKECGVEL
jgi:hypothetical protein